MKFADNQLSFVQKPFVRETKRHYIDCRSQIAAVLSGPVTGPVKAGVTPQCEVQFHRSKLISGQVNMWCDVGRKTWCFLENFQPVYTWTDHHHPHSVQLKAHHLLFNFQVEIRTLGSCVLKHSLQFYITLKQKRGEQEDLIIWWEGTIIDLMSSGLLYPVWKHLSLDIKTTNKSTFSAPRPGIAEQRLTLRCTMSKRKMLKTVHYVVPWYTTNIEKTSKQHPKHLEFCFMWLSLPCSRQYWRIH